MATLVDCGYQKCTFPKCDCNKTMVAGGKIKNEARERKETPIFSGVIKYFPLALAEVARVSFKGNEQHNPGKPLHWDRSKSRDEYDALTRHLVDHAVDPIDTDGERHLAKVAWRALAALQKELENG